MYSFRSTISIIAFTSSLATATMACAQAGHDVEPARAESPDLALFVTLPAFANDATQRPQSEPLDEGGCRWDVNDIRKQQADHDQQRRGTLPAAPDLAIGS